MTPSKSKNVGISRVSDIAALDLIKSKASETLDKQRKTEGVKK